MISFNKKINNYWNYLESKYPAPKFVGKIKYLEFKQLKKAIDEKNESYIKNIIRKMYVYNEAYILRNGSPKNLKETLLDLVNYYKNKKQSFHKMFDGTPNFHRAIDKKLQKSIVCMK